MPAGRPSKYNEEVLEKARDYLQNYESCGDVIPMACGLAVFLGVTENTIYNWANESNPEFLRLLGELKSKQHSVLIGKGLTGDFNSTITKLILTKHGYSDKVETTGADGGPIKTDTTWTIKVVDA
jgi:hypothetical protein